MQVNEKEIFVPFNMTYSPLPGDTLQTYVTGVFSLGAGIFCLVFHIGLLLPIALIAAGFFLLISPVVIAWGSMRISKQFIRMNHEGVLFAPHLTTVVQWADISTVTLSTWGDRTSSLSFVPRDPDAIITRMFKERTKNIFCLLYIKMNVLILRHMNAPPLLMISQTVSPIPLDELLALIQERFAKELRENRVTVAGWQENGTADLHE